LVTVLLGAAASGFAADGDLDIGQACRWSTEAGASTGNVLPFGVPLEEGGPHYAPDRAVDLRHIRIDLTPDFKRQTIAATTSLTFMPLARPLEQWTLNAVHLAISQVQSTAPVRDYDASGKHLAITFERPIPVGRETTVTIRYTAQPRRGLYFRTPEMGYPAADTHLWTQGETHEAPHWFPCFDYPNERASSEVICHVPAGMTVLSNGHLVSEKVDAATGQKTVHWRQDKPHASYLIALVAGYFAKVEARHRDIPLAFYTQPTLGKYAGNSFRDTARIMVFYEHEIGIPFPWDKYDQVTVRDFVAGGMENTSLTILTHRTIFTKATENIRDSRQLDAHEMAHQWFGDYVTCKDWSQLWLNEGFATYYAHLYEGHRFGRDALLYGLYQDATERIFAKESDRRPIVYRDYKDPGEQFDFRAYAKGSWVLHMLRSQLGDRLYRQAIVAYLRRHALADVVSEDLRQAFEALSGRPLDRFFDQWVYHGGFPRLKVDYRWLGTKRLARVSVEQVQKTSGGVMLFHFPVRLRFTCDGREIDEAITIRRAAEDFYVFLPVKPTCVRFDPEYSVLAAVTFDKSDAMLASQLDDPRDLIGRLLAANALGKRETSASVAHLRQALDKDAFYGVRIAAAKALATIHTDEAFAALRACQDQPDARVRLSVVESMGQFYRPETPPLLDQVLQRERNPAIQAAAIKGLGRFRNETARKRLVQYLHRDSFRNELADAAVDALGKYDDPHETGVLIDLLAHRRQAFTPRGLAALLKTLGHINRQQDDKAAVYTAIAGYLNDRNERIRIGAIDGLGQLRDPAARSLLEPLANPDRVGRTADAARKAMQRLDEQTPLVPEELIELRKSVGKLKKESQRLSKQVDELKKRLGAEAKQDTKASDGQHDP